MNTSTLKSFAPAVRRQLMEAVGRKLDVVLAAQTPDYLTTYASQVSALRRLAQTDRVGLIERVAYTWFNRLAALRYLDARGWHPFRARVLTQATPEETQPDLLRLMRTGALPEELHRHTNVARLNDLLDGRIPSNDPQGEVYRHLVLAACRFYHALLPDLFERLDDETELLLPDDLLTEHSVAQGFRTRIADEDCAEVELLGWLYQFYISEKKDAVMARKSAVPSEDIPAVTQLFTPHWIVRYLVENGLGRLWLLNRPNSQLRERMPYYIEGEAETDFLRITRPEEIRLIDPAVGSGHMLTYAFDLVYAIYEEEGYAPSEIAGLILKHNLYGVDIDPRAAQLASLALVLK
ncbi:MAG: BREX-1 system adenine-specific DNA-methyltransferase PglX, partial [Gemmatimonadota bacterium]|nr:BREX-1 system adenine-specific DNA-methyltransferase PglX [Gemmatimonadota bacterium]